MKKTMVILALLATVALVTSSQARVERTSVPGEAVTKGVPGPTVVSPITADIPIPDWFYRFFLKYKSKGSPAKKQEPAVQILKPAVHLDI